MKIVCAFILVYATLTSATLAITTGPCPQAAFLTSEQGVLTGVDWFEQSQTHVHTRSELTQSAIIDSTLSIRGDETVVRASTSFAMAGMPASVPKVHTFDKATIYWSDMVPSSLQQAVARARVLDRAVTKVHAGSLFTDAVGDIAIRRIDSTDWTVGYHSKTYQVLTDTNGCVISASLPDFGVTIERRLGFPESAYPLWSPYGAPPDRAYDAVDVAIRASGGAVLAGTLTKPLHAMQVPAVVVITGLSPHERNNGQPPWMPLRDIADALTRAGIAVLRVDDRGVGKSTGDNETWTTFDKVDDVRAEVRWLEAQPGIDPSRIALVGYSEGGLIAPMVAADDPSIAAVITLAGPGVAGPDLARFQIAARVDNDPSVAPAGKEKEIERQLAEPLDPHEKSFMSIDPLSYARRVRCPTLIVQGSTDLDVPVRSAERLATAMRSNGNRDVTVRLFPGISHSLLPDASGLDTGWATLPAFITSPLILDTVGGWAVGHLFRANAPH
ncbi:MAG TPA: alpha/beta fold hydrolase [Candidatus Eremiobacteraceae bacterium]